MRNHKITSCKKSAEPIVFRPEAGRRGEVESLNPHYIAGFIDGEGSFCVSIGRHKTLKRGKEVRIEFSIEVRHDDKRILERIQNTIRCGKIYKVKFRRQNWQNHVKYKIGSIKEINKFLIPFLEKYPLQAKKKNSYILFKKVVELASKKEHLTDKGFNQILKIKNKMRKISKKGSATARVRENRSPGGVRN